MGKAGETMNNGGKEVGKARNHRMIWSLAGRHGSGGFVVRSPALHASPARLHGTTSNLDPRPTGQGRRNGARRGRQERWKLKNMAQTPR